MPMIACHVCETVFFCHPYRLKKERKHPPTCSNTCARKMMLALGWRPYNTPEHQRTRERARQLYTQTIRTIDSIAQQLTISRSTLLTWAREGNWVKHCRTSSQRTRYRKAATAKLGRALIAYEQVHHVNGDVDNNVHDNLYVYPNASEHSQGHASLETCAFSLFRQGFICFDASTGRYYLP